MIYTISNLYPFARIYEIRHRNRNLQFPLISFLVSNHTLHLVHRSSKTAKFHFLAVHNVSRIRIFPLLRHGGILIGVYQQIKGAWLI
jgi:hypothetical protein